MYIDNCWSSGLKQIIHLREREREMMATHQGCFLRIAELEKSLSVAIEKFEAIKCSWENDCGRSCYSIAEDALMELRNPSGVESETGSEPVKKHEQRRMDLCGDVTTNMVVNRNL